VEGPLIVNVDKKKQYIVKIVDLTLPLH